MSIVSRSSGGLCVPHPVRRFSARLHRTRSSTKAEDVIVDRLQRRHRSIRPDEMMAQHFSTGLPDSADVVIIGGGVTGTSLLYELGEFTGAQLHFYVMRHEFLFVFVFVWADVNVDARMC